MYLQTPQFTALSDFARPTRWRDPFPSSPGVERPVLHVISLPDTPAANTDPAERDRQASIDFLHRLVMG